MRQKLTPRQTAAAVFTAAIIPLVAFMGVSHSEAQNDEAVGDAAQGQADSIRAIAVHAQRLEQAGPSSLKQTYTGIVTPRRSSLLAATTLGRVEAALVDIGDSVRQGELLVELDTRELNAERARIDASLGAAKALLRELEAGPRRQEIQAAQSNVDEMAASLALATANFERITRLFENGTVATQDRDESRAALDSARARLDAGQQRLQLLQEGTRTEQIDSQRAQVNSLQASLQRIDVSISEKQILAPFAGKIQQRFVDEGAIVSAGDKILEIVETSALEVHVGLPPQHSEAARNNDVQANVNGSPLKLSFRRISPVIDRTTRNLEAIYAIDDPSSPLLTIGQSVDVRIDTQQADDGYWIPNEALTAGARGLWAVFIAIPSESQDVSSNDVHTIERRQVELVRSQGNWSLIRGPLSPDELLVAEGVHRITSGQVVRCQEIDTEHCEETLVGTKP